MFAFTESIIAPIAAAAVAIRAGMLLDPHGRALPALPIGCRA